jgi:hypothetical protein
MSIEFTEKELDMLHSVACEKHEILCDDRKGVALTKYIFEVADGQTYWDGFKSAPVPDKYVGFWMMDTPSDLTWVTFTEACRTESWIRCVEQERIVKKWVAL